MSHSRLSDPADLLAALGAALIAETDELVLVLNTENRIVALSAAAARWFERSVEQLLGQNAAQLLNVAPDTELSSAALCAETNLRCSPLTGADSQPIGTLIRGDQPAPSPPSTPQLTPRERRLHNAAMVIGSSLNIDQLLYSLVQLAVELIGADAGALPLYDQLHDVVLPGYRINLGDVFGNPVQRRGTGLIWQVIDSRQALIVNDYQRQPGALPGLIASGVQSLMGVPVRNGTQIRGVLILYRFRADAPFSAQDRELIELVARQTDAALQNALLYQSTREEAAQRQALYSASIAIGAALDREELFTSIHRAVVSLMPCDAMAIGLYDAARRTVEYAYLIDGQGRWPPQQLPVERGLLGLVIRSAYSLRICHNDPQMEDDLGAIAFGSRITPTASLVAAPLMIGDTVVGALSVQSTRPDSYSSANLSTLEQLAATVAIALENARLFAQIQQMAATDALTGLPNRRAFFETALRELEGAQRYQRQLGILLFDIDHFKAINDTYGHIVGDQVLQLIAQRARASLRDADMVGRYGGEEFAAVLPETGIDATVQVAQRLREQVCRTPLQSDSGPIWVSISVGVACYRPDGPAVLEVLLDQADRALYRAKNAGRNQVMSHE